MPTSPHQILHPTGWPAPKGYSNGIAAEGRMVFVGGQIGWDETGQLVDGGFVGQTGQALRNILAVLAEAGGRAEHLVRLTWYVVDMAEYQAVQEELGQVYRDIVGRHYPAIALVEVAALAEPAARVEIEATAVVPKAP